MSVDLHVSEELLNAIGVDRFEAHLKLFDATVVERVDADRYSDNPFTVVYRLDVPGAPERATRIVPIFQSIGASRRVRLQSIEWIDAVGRIVGPTEAADV